MGERVRVSLTVNGTTYDSWCEPRVTLADFLRVDCGLTGTHVGCEHGVCGACTVLVDGASARSCCVLAAQVSGAEVETIEGLGADGRLHPLQEAFFELHGLQCGFCTPGMLMCSLELLQDNPDPTDEEIREHLSGNLCRCTGYQSIVASVRDAAGRMACRTDRPDEPLSS